MNQKWISVLGKLEGTLSRKHVLPRPQASLQHSTYQQPQEACCHVQDNPFPGCGAQALGSRGLSVLRESSAVLGASPRSWMRQTLRTMLRGPKDMCREKHKLPFGSKGERRK